MKREIPVKHCGLGKVPLVDLQIANQIGSTIGTTLGARQAAQELARRKMLVKAKEREGYKNGLTHYKN